MQAGLAAGGFCVLASVFFLAIGHAPLPLLWAMLKGAFGDGYSISESLVKASPILLCALATALPARLGLISVGAEGQLYAGALAGTAVVLAFPLGSAWMLLPAMLGAAALGGAFWGLVPGALKAGFAVNETLSTLLLNYVASLVVDFLVYGPWKDPGNLGWPATVPFPDAAKLPAFFGTRAHAGLLIGFTAALLAAALLGRTRWGLALAITRSNPKVARDAGLRFGPLALATLAAGGALAGIAGITETSMIQGRLQSGISNGMGFTGFLVAWLAGGSLYRLIPLSLLLGGLLASGDALQLAAGLPSSSALVLQGLLFVAALGAGGWMKRRGAKGVT